MENAAESLLGKDLAKEGGESREEEFVLDSMYRIDKKLGQKWYRGSLDLHSWFWVRNVIRDHLTNIWQFGNDAKAEFTDWRISGADMINQLQL